MQDYLYEFLNAALTHRPEISETRLEALAKELLEADAQWEDMLISAKLSACLEVKEKNHLSEGFK